MLEDEGHLLLVVLLGDDFSGIGHGSKFVLDFLLHFHERADGLLHVGIHALFNRGKLRVFLLDLECIL